MALLLCALSLFISIQDIRFHRISHKSIFLFAAIALSLYSPSSLFLSSVSLLILALFALATDLGGGDIKLIAIIILSQGKIWLTVESALISLMVTPFLILAISLNTRRWPAAVPLAPVILAPIGYFYLAM